MRHDGNLRFGVESGRASNNALYGEATLFPRWLTSPPFSGGEGSGKDEK